MAIRQTTKQHNRYVRVAIFPIEDVLPYVFTREIRYKLKENGYNYKSKEWIDASRKKYPAVIDGVNHVVEVSMGSHRYQLFAAKGVKCVKCGTVGTYFALERGVNNNPDRFHFNLYGRDRAGYEIMITKDHVIPRSKGGRNKPTNYQPMCYKCNIKKSNRLDNG